MINGKTDLILENNDGSITIVDYKSDYNPGLEKDKFAEMLESRYKDQLELYKKSFAEIYGVGEKQINTFIYNKNK